MCREPQRFEGVRLEPVDPGGEAFGLDQLARAAVVQVFRIAGAHALEGAQRLLEARVGHVPRFVARPAQRGGAAKRPGNGSAS